MASRDHLSSIATKSTAILGYPMKIDIATEKPMSSKVDVEKGPASDLVRVINDEQDLLAAWNGRQDPSHPQNWERRRKWKAITLG